MVASDGLEAWEILRGSGSPRLALLDRMMPGLEGAELCRMVREKEEGQEAYTYLILVTAKGSADQVVEGLEAGADDYLVKPFREEELRARVRTGRRIVRLHTDLLEAKEALALQARTDTLTGILNRRGILAELRGELNRAARTREPLGIVLFDLDQFKVINDRHGHLAGDAVLRECVKRVEGVIRSYDLFGRWGGDEFLVLLPETDEAEALSVCSRIREVVEEEPVLFEDTPIALTVSQGVTVVEGGGTVDVVIDLADRALLEAKETGRARVVPFSSPQ